MSDIEFRPGRGYRLAFEGLDTLTYLLIDTSVGTVLADEPHTLSLENGTCSTVITASHPRLQAYEGSTGYGPDTEIREALTGKCQILSSVREEDTVLLLKAWTLLPISLSIRL